MEYIDQWLSTVHDSDLDEMICEPCTTVTQVLPKMLSAAGALPRCGQEALLLSMVEAYAAMLQAAEKRNVTNEILRAGGRSFVEAVKKSRKQRMVVESGLYKLFATSSDFLYLDECSVDANMLVFDPADVHTELAEQLAELDNSPR